jgi:hypothetical protein
LLFLYMQRQAEGYAQIISPPHLDAQLRRPPAAGAELNDLDFRVAGFSCFEGRAGAWMRLRDLLGGARRMIFVRPVHVVLHGGSLHRFASR